MKIYLKYIVFGLGLLLFNCKDNTVKTETTAQKTQLTEAEKTEIVTYYLINDRKLSENDFHEIIFLNDFVDGVKVIFYEGKDAFFGFKFSEALEYYNSNNK